MKNLAGWERRLGSILSDGKIALEIGFLPSRGVTLSEA